MKITAKQLADDQKKRFLRLKQKEQENSVAESARADFRRKPYHMGQDRCGNSLGERE